MKANKASLLLGLLLLTACSAAGKPFNEAEIPKGSLVIYKDDTYVGSGRIYPIEINGQPACDLHIGYYVSNAKGDVNISASWSDMPGTSRYKVHVGKETVYIKMSVNGSKATSQIFGGYVGLFAAEAVDDSAGPFMFERTDASGLKGLKQDCL